MNNDNSTKVCVAICNYNHNKYLRQSIASIVNQTYKNLDIVVVDDGSDDAVGTRDIVQSFSDERIRYIQIGKNTGKWNALNIAFGSTDATICTSHDADDVSLHWRIAAQVNALLETKTIHNLCGFTSCWSDDEVDNSYANMQEPTELKVAAGEEVVKAVLYGFDTPGINHYFTGNFETAGVSSMFYKRIWQLGFRFLPPGQNLRTLLSEDSDFNLRVTTALRSTSLLLEAPYLYRRNTSTNKEER